MNEILLKSISLLHIIFIIFVIFTPMTKSNYFLTLHSVFLPFLMVHWVLNDNNCVITIVEKQIKKNTYGIKYNEDDDCITCKLIEPVYDFKKNNEQKAKFIYSITTILWFVSLIKLYSMYNNDEISEWKDLFII